MLRLIFVGGFLGAGKTTALTTLAERLTDSGYRIGIITNDQTEHLVDTEIAKIKLNKKGVYVEEVTEGCFCCNFDTLIGRIKKMLPHKPDIILGEPVGSCTDFIASVANPIKRYYGDMFHISPFTVLVEPRRIKTLLTNHGTFPGEVKYLFNKQLEEAEIIALNKIDTIDRSQVEEFITLFSASYPDKKIIAISAKQGDGIDHWLKILFDKSSGKALQEIDYDKYAKAEAMLGWLNGVFKISARQEYDADKFCRELLRSLKNRFLEAKAEIGHLKLIATLGNKSLYGSVTGLNFDEELTGQLGRIPEWVLIINARINLEPEPLKDVVFDVLNSLCNKEDLSYKTLNLKCLSPAYPNPPYLIRE